MCEERISGIVKYVEIITGLNNTNSKENFFHDSDLLFRGQGDKDYELIPSIARNRHSACSYTIFNEERNLIDLAKFKMPDLFSMEQSPVELLALLQHHGIPTRLLDVTENALVALYFACASITARDKDAEVIVFKASCESITNYPIINAIADSYRLINSTWEYLSSFYEKMKVQPYFLEQVYSLNSIHTKDMAGATWIQKCCDKPMYIYAPIRSERQKAQRGRYILFPNDITVEDGGTARFEAIISPMSKEHEDIICRIIIPKEKKTQILKDLSILGIDEPALFCDNVDTVCKGIVERFKKKGCFE